MKKRTDKQLLFERMNHVAGMPLKEELDPNYDPMDDFNRNQEPDYEPGFSDILADIEKAFDTTTYDMGGETYIAANDSDLMIYDEKGMFTVYVNGEKVFEDRTVNVNPQDVIDALKPYENLMLKGEEAKKRVPDTDQMWKDKAYANQEKSAEFYGQQHVNMERDSAPEDSDLWENKKLAIKKRLFETMDNLNGTNLSEKYDPRFDDNDEGDPDAGHTVNGVELSPEEYRKWYEEEGEYDDTEGREYKRRRY